MAAQLLISFLLSISLVASGLLIAQAAKEPPGKTANKSATSASEPAAKPPEHPQPVLMELSTNRDTFRANQDIMVKAELWAVQPVTLCLYPNHPEANFAAEVYRAGFGKLNNVPNVVQLGNDDMNQVERIQLDAGQMHRVMFNVKKLVPLPNSFWKTGEYRMQIKFYLCGRTEGQEQAIASQGPLHLLILE